MTLQDDIKQLLSNIENSKQRRAQAQATVKRNNPGFDIPKFAAKVKVFDSRIEQDTARLNSLLDQVQAETILDPEENQKTPSLALPLLIIGALLLL